MVCLHVCLLFTVSCAQLISDESQEETNDVETEFISYENEDANDQKLPTNFEGYEQSKQRKDLLQDDSDNKITDQYTTEETQMISEHLMNLQEIQAAQVASTDDRVVVGVILNRNADRHIGNMIEEEVRKFVNDDKDIVVYTDDTYWYQRRNLDAKANATQLGEDLEELLDDFFNIRD